MAAPEIPGYIYDDEKRRYFKIEENHQAPKGAKHSKGKIKEEEREAKKRKLVAEKEEKATRERGIGCGRVRIESSLSGLSLNREHGSSPRLILTRYREAYRTGLTRYQYGLDAHFQSQDVEIDTETDMVFYSHPTGISRLARPMRWHNNGKLLEAYSSAADYSQLRLHAGSRSLISHSVHANGRSVIRVFELMHDYEGRLHTSDECPWTNRSLLYKFKDESVWCVEPSPSNESSLSFAVGSSDGLGLYNPESGTIDQLSNKEWPAISWLSSDVVAGGQRTGAIKIFDRRTRRQEKRLVTLALGSVTCLKAISDNQMVTSTAGFPTCLYDIRMNGVADGDSHELYSRRIVGSRVRPTFTKPVLVFDEYELGQAHTPNSCLAVNPRLQVMASSQNEGRIDLYSLQTGRLLRKFKAGGDERVTSLKFVNSKARAPEIWAAGGPSIVRLTWNAGD